MKKESKLVNNARILKFKGTGYTFMCNNQWHNQEFFFVA